MINNSFNNETSIYNTDYYVKLSSLFDFELKSFLGRRFFSQKPKLKLDNNFLHLGSGSNKIPNWINADFFALKFWKWQQYPNKPDWMIDLRYPLNCEDNVWDGIFSEHTLEHLYPVHVLQLLKELNRTMKSGAWLRISVPDLNKYVNYYQGRTVEQEFITQWQTGCEAMRALTQNYAHLSLWDSKLMKQFLQDAGFVNIQQVDFGQGNNPQLLHDQIERKWESLYMEAQKA
jgi:predicted SAM-dependent methyltransferase